MQEIFKMAITGKALANVFADGTFWSSLVSILLSLVLLFWFLKEKKTEKKKGGVIKVSTR